MALTLAGVILLLGLTGNGGSALGQVPTSLPTVAVAESATEPMPLVDLNEDYQQWLLQADKLLAKGNVTEAVQAYQALIEKGQQVLYRAGPKRFVCVSKIAAERVGALGPEALAMYHTLYDPPAEQLFSEASRDLERRVLVRIVNDYYHTSVGDRALDMLASLQFDQGRFAEAGRNWQRLLDRKSGLSVRRDVLLCKNAVAWHLAGVPSVRDRRISELQASFADSEAVLAGRRQNVLAFTLATCKLEAPEWVGAGPVGKGEWPSLAGSPDGVAVMAECRAVSKPRWRYPADPKASLHTSEMQSLRTRLIRTNHSNNRNWKADLRDGQLRFVPIGRNGRVVPVPPMTHPVASHDLLLVRSHESIDAYDPLLGELRWRAPGLPMVRTGVSRSTVSRGTVVGDRGRYALSVGDGMAYAVSDFSMANPTGRVMLGQPRGRSGSSQLVAIHVRSGKRAWSVGNGIGLSDVVKAGTFLCPPTYAEGRLYAVVRLADSYFLVCLDPRREGAVVWEAMIGQCPTPSGVYSYQYQGAFDHGSPPAVSHGRVFVTTNAGLISAFDADNGRNLWAHQYGQSTINTGSSYRSSASVSGMMNPPNPLIVTRGQVIVLPTDHDSVISLCVSDGQEQWRQPRQRQRHLTAVGPARLLLSAPSLVILDAVGGKQIWTEPVPADSVNKAETGIYGRPAVSPTTITTSRPGYLVRICMATEDQYEIQNVDLGDPKALLGNLLSLDNMLIAASAGSICAYMEFDEALRSVNARLKGMTAAQRAAALFDRSRLYMSHEKQQETRAEAAKLLDAALADLIEVRRHAESVGNHGWVERLRPRMRQAYVRRGDRAADDAEMKRMYELAAGEADTPSTRGEMQIRFCRLAERTGDYAVAVGIAHELIARRGTETDVKLRDVQIGAAAGEVAYDDLDARPAHELGGRHVARLIQLYGPEVYATFDALAKKALVAAGDDATALLAAQKQYPHSKWADEMLLAASEAMYAKAIGGPFDDAAGLAATIEALTVLRDRYADRPLALSAQVGLAMVALRQNPQIAQMIHGPAFASGTKTTRVKFSDFDGTVADLLERLAAARTTPTTPITPVTTRGRVRTPLKEVYRVNDATVEVLRDDAGRVLRIGKFLMLVRQRRIVCLDTSADVFGKAIRWQTEPLLDAKSLARVFSGLWGSPLAGHLFDGDRRMLVTDAKTLFLLDTASGKILGSGLLKDLNIGTVSRTVFDGQHVVFSEEGGKLTCVRVGPDGSMKRTWAAKAPGTVQMAAAKGRLLVVSATGRRGVFCYDIRTGKLRLGRAGGSVYCDAVLTDEGLVVMLVGRELSLHDPGKVGAPIWKTSLAPPRPILLGAGPGQVAVGDGLTAPAGQLIDLADPAGRIPFIVPGPTRRFPVLAEFVGGSVVLTCTTSPRQPGRTALVAPGKATSPALVALNARTGKLLWGPSAPAGDAKPRTVHRPIVGTSHIVVWDKPTEARSPMCWTLVATATGGIAQQWGVPTPAGLDMQRLQARRLRLRPPVLTDGRMIVECLAGLIVLAEGERE